MQRSGRQALNVDVGEVDGRWTTSDLARPRPARRQRRVSGALLLPRRRALTGQPSHGDNRMERHDCSVGGAKSGGDWTTKRESEARSAGGEGALMTSRVNAIDPREHYRRKGKQHPSSDWEVGSCRLGRVPSAPRHMRNRPGRCATVTIAALCGWFIHGYFESSSENTPDPIAGRCLVLRKQQ